MYPGLASGQVWRLPAVRRRERGTQPWNPTGVTRGSRSLIGGYGPGPTGYSCAINGRITALFMALLLCSNLISWPRLLKG